MSEFRPIVITLLRLFTEILFYLKTCITNLLDPTSVGNSAALAVSRGPCHLVQFITVFIRFVLAIRREARVML